MRYVPAFCLAMLLAAGSSFAAPTAPLAAEGTITSSSIRWKEKVRPITNALSVVLRMQGVTFTWKKPNDPENKKRDIGFIAEEVGKVFPELVEWEVEGKTANGLKYDRVSALTVEAIKEQQVIIERLASQVALLQNQVTAHEVRLCSHDTLIAEQNKKLCSLETQVCTLQTSMTEMKELVRELDFALAAVEDKVAEIQPCTCGSGGQGGGGAPAAPAGR